MRKEFLEALEARVSAAQSVSEKQAADLVDAQVAALRQQVSQRNETNVPHRMIQQCCGYRATGLLSEDPRKFAD